MNTQEAIDELRAMDSQIIHGSRVFRDIAEIVEWQRNQRHQLLSAVQMAYQKHHMGLAAIGWEQLGEKLHNTLCEVMGDEEYERWSSSFEDEERSML